MSKYSMSPPQKPAPRPFSPPYSAAGSPVNAPPHGQPPAKRQRLSPDPRAGNGATSPYAAAANGLPMSYGNPYAPHGAQSPYTQASPSTFASSPQSAFNTPQPYHPQPAPWQSQPPTPAAGPNRHMSPPNAHTQSSQMMPPPPRPNKEEKEERVGVDEIGDSLFGSGINIKDEENYLHSTFNNRHGVNNTSFTSNQSTSFGSGTMSASNSFDLLTQSTSFSGQPDGPFAGTLNQRPRSQEDIEKELQEKRARAARDLNERMQHHLNNQFLLGNGVRARLDKRAREHGVQWNVTGLYRRQDRAQTHTMVNGAGKEGIAAVDNRPEYTVERNSHADQLLTLVSLATGERLRSLLGEAHALARARRYGDHGRVPPEFADIAVGEGKRVDEVVVPQNITGSSWDQVPSSEHDSPKSAISTAPQPLPTFSFHSTVAARLREVADQDRKAEEARIKKREARRRAASETAAAAGGSETDPAAATGDNPSTAPDAPAEAAAPVVKVSKKEQAKREKEAKNSSEAQLHTTINQTANMMARGKKGNRYTWMTGAGATPLVNRFQKAAERANAAGGAGSAAGTDAVSPAPGGGGSSGEHGAQATVKGGSEQGRRSSSARPEQWGEWREDGVGGKGIQVRDWIAVLERDGKEGLALQRVWTMLQ